MPGYNASENEKIVRAMMPELKHLRSPHYRHHITDDKISKVVKVSQSVSAEGLMTIREKSLRLQESLVKKIARCPPPTASTPPDA